MGVDVVQQPGDEKIHEVERQALVVFQEGVDQRSQLAPHALVDHHMLGMQRVPGLEHQRLFRPEMNFHVFPQVEGRLDDLRQHIVLGQLGDALRELLHAAEQFAVLLVNAGHSRFPSRIPQVHRHRFPTLSLV